MGTDQPYVLVTGATGYIALHVVRLLQREGYKVRGTVRTINNEAKLHTVKNVCPEAVFPLELVETNLLEDKGWDEAVKGCAYVLHVASPFPNGTPKHEDDVIIPAVDGTKRVLRACADSGTVKRVVLTSSISAIHGENTTRENILYTENDWSNLESKHIEAYAKSKTMAEKAAWDYVNDLPSNKRFELVVLNPGLVFGPVLNSEISTSLEVIYRMMYRITMPLIPKINFCMCDVRDVALAHLRAMKVPEAAGHRHLVVSGHLWMGDMTKMLHEEFSKQGYGINLLPAPFYLMWLYSFLDKPTALLLPRLGKVYRYDDNRMKNILGIQPRDPKQTVLDTAYSMIENGVVVRSKFYSPPKRNVFE